MRQKRPVYAAKETCLCEKRDLLMRQKRPSYASRDLLTINLRRPLWFLRAGTREQKKPIYAAKETYLCGKRDLFMRQKKPIYAAKETYLCGKRDMQKRPAQENKRNPGECLLDSALGASVCVVNTNYSKRTHSIVREHNL